MKLEPETLGAQLGRAIVRHCEALELGGTRRRYRCEVPRLQGAHPVAVGGAVERIALGEVTAAAIRPRPGRIGGQRSCEALQDRIQALAALRARALQWAEESPITLVARRAAFVAVSSAHTSLLLSAGSPWRRSGG